MSELQQAFVIESGEYSDRSIVGVSDSLESAKSLVRRSFDGLTAFSEVSLSLIQTRDTWEIRADYIYLGRKGRSVYDVTAYPVVRGEFA